MANKFPELADKLASQWNVNYNSLAFWIAWPSNATATHVSEHAIRNWCIFNVLTHKYQNILQIIILLVMANTSLDSFRKNLGIFWNLIHKCVYLALFFAAIHYVLMIRSDWLWPASYALISMIIVLVRFKFHRIFYKLYHKSSKYIIENML